MALLFLGKLLIAVGLCFQAYLLFDNEGIAQNFNINLSKILGSCDCLPPMLLPLLQQHLRIVVVVLLSFSGIMVFTRSSFIKFLVLIGFLTLSYVRHYPITKLPPLSNNIFYEHVAIIGGIIYLMGADRSNARHAKAEPKVKEKPL